MAPCRDGLSLRFGEAAEPQQRVVKLFGIRGLAWNDPTLAIDWPVKAEDAILSDKDQRLGRLADFVTPFHYDET